MLQSELSRLYIVKSERSDVVYYTRLDIRSVLLGLRFVASDIDISVLLVTT